MNQSACCLTDRHVGERLPGAVRGRRTADDGDDGHCVALVNRATFSVSRRGHCLSPPRSLPCAGEWRLHHSAPQAREVFTPETRR